ncbi:PAS domain-containing protein [Nisaea acidiphila]|uniref:PAS domain-containing protein n=1 Tax=Nisaea acidiphila TaxID=1862145 RepID=A0A9J7APG1_9PROT|nr:PAS domain-containing protein [Nisaea acidiphila]UUX49507.1 PAS domain-containing protein [Nisaea acidiphila]
MTPKANVSEKPFENVSSPLLREAFRLWQEKRRDRPMASRADFDPLEMPGLLPLIILLDVEGSRNRMKVRLAGTKIVEMFGSDYTGSYLDEIDFGDVREKVLREYGLAVTEKRPVFSDHSFRKPDDYRHKIERAILPLSNDGESVNMLLAVLDFERQTDLEDGY